MVPRGIDQLQGVHGRGQALVAAATAVGAAPLDVRALAARVRGQPRPPWARIAKESAFVYGCPTPEATRSGWRQLLACTCLA